jgi:hypothetical protein
VHREFFADGLQAAEQIEKGVLQSGLSLHKWNGANETATERIAVLDPDLNFLGKAG